MRPPLQDGPRGTAVSSCPSGPRMADLPSVLLASSEVVGFAKTGGLADVCGGVWEIVLDHFDPKGGHEEPLFAELNYRPVCRSGNYFDVPGNARIAVRLGLQGVSYSDSRDGFRIALGVARDKK